MDVNKLLLRSSKDKPGITALTRYSKWIINALITRGVLNLYSGLIHNVGILRMGRGKKNSTFFTYNI